MAKAAFIALVMNVDRGRSDQELDRAMSPSGADAHWVRKESIYSHISAVRRCGLKVKFESQKYRVLNLRADQVDALRFRRLRDQVRDLESQPVTDKTVAEIATTCRQALLLWVEDPAEAHPFLYDTGIFAGDRERYAVMKAAYARALLKTSDLRSMDLAEATEAIEDLRRMRPGSPEVIDLDSRLSRRQSSVHEPLSGSPLSEPAAPTRIPWLSQYQEYLEDVVTSIDLRAFGSKILSASSLATVYTPLYVRPRSTEQPAPERRRDASRPMLEAVVESIRAALIVGQSGSGKSTFLLHLCRRYLQERAQVPLLFELVELSSLLEEELDARGRMPSNVIAQALADRLNAVGIPATVEDIDYLSSSGQAVWLLDGLNEIPVSEVRRAVADAISVCARRWRRSRFLVTTTEAALITHSVPPGLERVDIDDFRPQDIKNFLEAFASDFYPELDQAERMKHWEPLLTRILAAPDLRDLARTPLHLTAMALIYFTEGRLPDSRADLLQAAVAWLIRKRVPILRSFVQRGRNLELVFAELAYLMAAAGERPLARVGKQWAAAQIAEMSAFGGGVAQAREFLDVVISTGGPLVARGPGDVGMHDAFRNYLAASFIAGKTDDEESGWWGEVTPHLDDPDWRHILTLVPGCLLALGSDRVDLFFDRLGKSCSSQALPIRASRVALGGGVLRELTLADYRLGNVRYWHDAVKGLKELFYAPTDLSLEVRYESAVAYGLTGDDRLDSFEATWVWLDGGQFWMGAQAGDSSGRNYDPDAAPWESPVRLVTMQPFAMRKYPITVEEYKAFLEGGGYTEQGNRWWSPEGLEWRGRSSIVAPLEWDEQLMVPNAPVTGVSWFECLAYCRWLTERAGNGVSYRLPYEREWEYAARRGIGPGKQFKWGDRMHWGTNAEANWAGCFLRRKSPVGMFPRSTTTDGIADLFGNVEEWCLDAWEDYQNEATVPDDTTRVRAVAAGVDPPDERFSEQSVKRAVRGGSCIRFSRLCRPTYRSRILQDRRYLTVGFRPMRPADPRSQ